MTNTVAIASGPDDIVLSIVPCCPLGLWVSWRTRRCADPPRFAAPPVPVAFRSRKGPPPARLAVFDLGRCTCFTTPVRPVSCHPSGGWIPPDCGAGWREPGVGAHVGAARRTAAPRWHNRRGKHRGVDYDLRPPARARRARCPRPSATPSPPTMIPADAVAGNAAVPP
jgi:hypothetical protein